MQRARHCSKCLRSRDAGNAFTSRLLLHTHPSWSGAFFPAPGAKASHTGIARVMRVSTPSRTTGHSRQTTQLPDPHDGGHPLRAVFPAGPSASPHSRNLLANTLLPRCIVSPRVRPSSWSHFLAPVFPRKLLALEPSSQGPLPGEELRIGVADPFCSGLNCVPQIHMLKP